MDTQGSLWAILLYDIAEQIQLDQLRSILGVQPAVREPRFKHLAPDYVRFDRPPLEQSIEAPLLESGDRLQARIKYFEYGVLAVELELPFEVPWEDLIERSSRWIGSPEIEKLAGSLGNKHPKNARPAPAAPYAAGV